MERKKKKRIIIAVSIATVLLILLGLGLYFVQTPEFALIRIGYDVSQRGVDGLRPHLTEDALAVVDTITAISENKLLGTILGMLSDSDYTGVLKEELEKVDWGLQEIIKEDDQAWVVVTFDYESRLAGTVAITMLDTDDGWKIDGLELPKFEKINW